MPTVRRVPLLLALALLASLRPLAAQDPPQTQTDDYTRYELEAPGSGAFHILYDVTATTAGARFYYNGIREGAEEVVHGVTDLGGGQPAVRAEVTGRNRAPGHPQDPTPSREHPRSAARPSWRMLGHSRHPS